MKFLESLCLKSYNIKECPSVSDTINQLVIDNNYFMKIQKSDMAEQGILIEKLEEKLKNTKSTNKVTNEKLSEAKLEVENMENK